MKKIDVEKMDRRKTYEWFKTFKNPTYGVNVNVTDEQGNETNYLSFDVFMGRSAKSRNVDLTPDVAYLYKDLSEYYKNKYPQAGVKTVVVSYAVSIK